METKKEEKPNEVSLAEDAKVAIKALIQEEIKGLLKGNCEITIECSKEVKDIIQQSAEGVASTFEDKIKAVAEKLAPAQKEVTIKNGDNIFKVKGLTHYMFEQIAKLVNTAMPTYLYGAAGAGKTTLAAQIAKALGLKYYPVYGGPTLTESKLLGYRNAATGHYVKGLCYDPYVNGGLLFIDEADVGEGLIGLNALLANELYRFPDGEVVERHKDFRVLAAGNTNWNGATGSYKRTAADGAFKDRFIRVPFSYDEKLELNMIPAEYTGWAKYVHSVRNYVATKTKDNRAVIGPRAILKGVAALSCGAWTPEQCADHIVMVDLSDDIKLQVKKDVGMPNFTVNKV